jgi:putative ABC transport system substrate-binding protein
MGFVEGQSFAIEYRFANGQADKFPVLAAELVQLRVAVIVATGGSGLAAKAATSTIPIVVQGGGDPVRTGIVASISRPGGNVTAVHLMSSDLDSKCLGLLHQMAPQATAMAAFIDPNVPESVLRAQEVQAAA